MTRSRSDSNAREIVDNIRATPDFSAEFIRGMRPGIPDIIVGHKTDRNKRFNYLFELKSPKGHLRPEQMDFVTTWNGLVYVVRSSYEVFALIKECEGL